MHSIVVFWDSLSHKRITGNGTYTASFINGSHMTDLVLERLT